MSNLKSFFSERKGSYAVVACIFFAGLLVRVVYYMLSDRISKDSFYYMSSAEFLLKSGWNIKGLYVEKVINCPSLIFYYLAFAKSIGIDIKFAGIALSLISGALVPIGIYLCSVQIFKNRIYAFFASLIVAVHPYCVEISTSVLRDAPYHCLFLFAIAAGMRAAITGKTRYWALFGFFAGMAGLFRIEAQELILIYIAWAAYFLFRKKEEKFKKVFIWSLAVGSCFFVVTYPFWLYVEIHTGHAWRLYQPMHKLFRYNNVK